MSIRKRDLSSASTVLLLAAWAAVAGFSGSAHAQTTLSTDTECHDGAIVDLAVQPDASSGASGKRAWIAQGRVRAAVRLDTAARVDSENATFSSIAGHYELLQAVEVDDTNHYLYTLTQQGLYREDIGGSYSPSNPGNRIDFDFTSGLSPVLQSGEELVDVKLIPHTPGGGCTDQYVLVLTTYRLIIMASGSSSLSVQGQCLDLESLVGTGTPYLQKTPSDATFDNLHINSFVGVKVAFDYSGKTIAYLFGNIGSYALHAVQIHSVILLCDLDGAHCFATPTLNVATGGNVDFAYWNSMAGISVGNVPDYAAYDFDVRVQSTETDLLVACGKAQQLQWLTADFASGGISVAATKTLDSAEHLLLSQFDPNTANHVYVRGESTFFDVDITGSPITFTSVSGDAFTRKQGDSAAVLLPGTGGNTKSIWTMGNGSLDYHIKIFDVTSGTPSVRKGLPYLYRSDGGVAFDFSNTYVLTAGGVQHYQLNSGNWDQKGYEPTPSTYGNCFAEQLDFGHIASGDDRLLAPANTYDSVNVVGRSGLFDWHLDATTHEPQSGTYYDIPTSVFSNWNASNHDQIYTNDIAFMDWNGDKWAVLCPTLLPGGNSANSDYAVAVFKWSSGSWNFVTSAETAGQYASLPHNGYADTITLGDTTTTPTAGKAAFLALDSGVASFDLGGLSATPPTIAFRNYLQYTNAGGAHPGTSGIVVARGRLVIVYGQGQTAELAIYDWDRSTTPGTITTPPHTPITAATLGLPMTFNKTFRLRFDAANSTSGYIYDCTGGYLFRLLYDATGSGTLYYDTPHGGASWNSLDTSTVQDCRVYTFSSTKKLLVTKDEESFAWVLP